MKSLIPIILLGLLPCIGVSQAPAFKHYTVEDGLPSSEIYHVMQDKKGFIWFATNIGVSRFDGYKFENFDMQDGLPDNTIFEIYEDYMGRLWFISFSCQLSYYFNDSIYVYKYNKEILQLERRFPDLIPAKKSFYIDSLNTLYFSIRNFGIVSISNDGKVNRINYNINDSYINVSKIDNTFLISTTYPDSIVDYKWEININPLEAVFNEKDILDGKTAVRRYMVLNDKNNFILLIDNYIIKVANDKSLFAKPLDKDLIWISKDSKNHIWVGSINNGVICYKDADSLNLKEVYFPNHSISSTIQDTEGAYWFTTLEDGVFYVPSLNIRSITQDNGLITKNITCIEPSNTKKLIIGMANNHIAEYRNNKNYIKRISNDKQEVVTSILEVNDIAFIGTNKRLYKWHNKDLIQIEDSHRIAFYLKSIDIIKERKIDVTTLQQIDEHSIAIASRSGFLILENEKTIYHSSYDDKFQRRISDIFPLAKNKIFLGCIDGLWEYNNGNYKYHGDDNELLKSRIIAIGKNKTNDKLWLGTKGNGLLLMDNDTVIQYTTANGLTSNTITSIEVDSNIIWAATNNGLNRIRLIAKTPYKIKVQNITTNKGLISNEINQVKLKDSIVYLATTKGVSYFNKNKITQNKILPPVYISQIQIMNNDTVIKTAYKLPYNQNHLTINYVGLNYKNAGNINYEYMMKGAKSDWIKTNNTQIQFPFLSPGKYKFQVRAINEDGFKSENPATVHFQIKPPYWKTWWFLIMISIITLFLIYYLFHRREKAIKYHNQLKEESFRNLQRALNAQLNPHFVFNSLNAIQNYILNYDKNTSNTFLTKFAKLMRNVLENSQHSKIPIKRELETLELYIELEKLRFDDKFDYIFEIPEKLYRKKIEVPPLLFQPFVENAIIHGLRHKDKNGKLTISIEERNNEIICIIEDNGIGRAKSKEINKKMRVGHQSFGIDITKKRMHLQKFLHNNEIKVVYEDLIDDHGNALGTRVITTISL